MKKIYFIFTDAGTILGKIIKLKTGRKYTHVSISLDENLNEMYSFSRIKLNAHLSLFHLICRCRQQGKEI